MGLETKSLAKSPPAAMPNVTEKGENRKAAADQRNIVVFLDTGPRGEGVPRLWPLTASLN